MWGLLADDASSSLSYIVRSHANVYQCGHFSALATGSAFGALWLSDHPGTASMGLILMISLVWTLVCALIFEPALLGTARRHTDAQLVERKP